MNRLNNYPLNGYLIEQDIFQIISNLFQNNFNYYYFINKVFSLNILLKLIWISNLKKKDMIKKRNKNSIFRDFFQNYKYKIYKTKKKKKNIYIFFNKNIKNIFRKNTK